MFVKSEKTRQFYAQQYDVVNQFQLENNKNLVKTEKKRNNHPEFLFFAFFFSFFFWAEGKKNKNCPENTVNATDELFSQ